LEHGESEAAEGDDTEPASLEQEEELPDAEEDEDGHAEGLRATPLMSNVQRARAGDIEALRERPEEPEDDEGKKNVQ
jgi:hypothetical protein